MQTHSGFVLKQGAPFAFVFDLTEDDGATALPLPVNCGFRMQIRAAYADPLPLLSISSAGDAPSAVRIDEAFEIAVPSSVTEGILGPPMPARLITDIEIFDLLSGECVLDGGAYPVQWIPEVTK
jgi:hypothetical protein